ncbi:MAG: MATE family efflux transporter [Chthoniobacterales bacterium]
MNQWGGINNYREILRVAIPVSLESVFQASFTLVDQLIVGVLGATAVAAVGLSNGVSFIIALLYSAIGTGSGVIVAQAFGRQDMKAVSKVATLGQIMAAVFGGCTALPLMLFPAVILRAVGAQGDLVGVASGYFQLFAASMPMTVTSAVTAATFRSLSDARTPMVITMAAVILNTLLALLLVLGLGPFPKLGVIGAGLASLISQAARCLGLLVALYHRKRCIRWCWPGLGKATREIARPLFEITYPIALSEMLWGTSTFIYTIVFTRLGTAALASSQIVMTIENLFIVAAAGLPPAAVASIGQAIGEGSWRHAKKQAGLVLRLGVIVGLGFGAALMVASFLLPVLYPRVGKDVVHLAFWGISITACVQVAKVLNNILGNGILPSGGDTKFVLLTHVIGSYAAGLPAALLLGIVARLGAQSVFAARALEEVLKMFIFLLRYRTPSWYRKSMNRPAAASSKP